MKALGLVVSEKIFLCFSHCKSMGANDPRGGAIFDPRGMIGRIYKKDHYTLLHTKYEGSGPCGFEEEDLFYVLPHHPTPKAGPVWTPGARLAGFIKRTTLHCYTQNMKGLGLVVSEKIFFMFFPIVSLWPVYGSYLLPWKPEFQSDLAQNLMQPFPLLNDALDKI